MIKYKDQMRVQTRENVFGGAGSYECLHLFEQQELDKTRLFALNTMPPGVSLGAHTHTGEGEAYVILSGEAVVQEDGVEHVLHAGDVQYCTGGHSHAICNRSDAPMQFLAIVIL